MYFIKDSVQCLMYYIAVIILAHTRAHSLVPLQYSRIPGAPQTPHRQLHFPATLRSSTPSIFCRRSRQRAALLPLQNGIATLGAAWCSVVVLVVHPLLQCYYILPMTLR